MPGFIEATLHTFQHILPAKPEHFLHTYTHPVYHKGLQLAHPLNCSLELLPKGKHCIQQIISMLKYYVLDIDPTMLTSINIIAI
eukprot:2502053-Ditylum_brightwellii.AAC.1